MREHLSFSMPYRLEGAPGLNRQYRGVGLLPGLARYYAFHSGPMATGPYEVGVFARTSPDADRPDMQFYLSPYTRAGKRFVSERQPGLTHARHAVADEQHRECRHHVAGPRGAPGDRTQLAFH